MSKEHVVHVPHDDVAPEEARGLRARAWRFVFDCWEQKKAASENSGEERARKEKYVSRNQTTR
jgi:hypothetical protein